MQAAVGYLRVSTREQGRSGVLMRGPRAIASAGDQGARSSSADYSAGAIFERFSPGTRAPGVATVPTGATP